MVHVVMVQRERHRMGGLATLNLLAYCVLAISSAVRYCIDRVGIDIIGAGRGGSVG